MRQAILHVLCILTCLMAGPVAAAPKVAASPKVIAPTVIVSVLPVQALVAEVMTGAGTPELLIPPGVSPHDFTLKPSDARSLRDALLVVRVGAALEPALDRPLAALDRRRVITLLDDPRLTRRTLRRSDSRITPLAGGAYDPHLWLDPDNAIVILRITSDALSKADPAQASLYGRNAAAAITRVEQLKTRMDKLLRPVQKQPFLSFHDAYQYLERYSGLNNRGFIVTHAENPTVGVRHIRELREIIRRDHVRCLFTEPEYEPKLITPVIEDLPVRVMMLDHLGASVSHKGGLQGLDLYLRIMDKLARDLASCLAAPAPSS